MNAIPKELAGLAVPISSLREDPRNARRHGKKNLDAIKESLRLFGQRKPIVVRDGVVIAGNGTLAAARALGWDRIAAVPFDGSDEHAKAYALADNRTAEMAEWDPGNLKDALVGLAEWAPEEGWSPEALGFDEKSLGGMGMDMSAGIVEDEPPEPPKVPITKKGDLWILGEHRLLCGDCAEHPPGDPWDLLVTDPPYGVSYASKNEFLNSYDKGNHLQTEIVNDHAKPEEMSVFWSKCFSALRGTGRPGAAYYVTGPQGGDLLLLLLLLLQALRDSKFQLKHMLIWAKQQFVLGRCDYHYQHEPILYGWLDGAGHKFHGPPGENSLWQIDRPRESKLHPTMKPVELYARAIRNSSLPGEIVAEPFSGSGTSIVACEQLGRRCRAVEIDPGYVDVAVERWQALTGGKARRG